MERINFSLQKNNKFVIKKNNIKCIKQKNKLLFKINNDKYTYNNKILIKETSSEIITFNFINKTCNIFLKDHNMSLNIKINEHNIDENTNFIEIKYKIETEIDYINIIRLEYV